MHSKCDRTRRKPKASSSILSASAPLQLAAEATLIPSCLPQVDGAEIAAQAWSEHPCALRTTMALGLQMRAACG